MSLHPTPVPHATKRQDVTSVADLKFPQLKFLQLTWRIPPRHAGAGRLSPSPSPLKVARRTKSVDNNHSRRRMEQAIAQTVLWTGWGLVCAVSAFQIKAGVKCNANTYNPDTDRPVATDSR
jgi:hypothetical protein